MADLLSNQPFCSNDLIILSNVKKQVIDHTAQIAQYELLYISTHIWYRKLEFFYTVMQ